MADESDIELMCIPKNFVCLCGVIAHVLLFIAFIKDPLKCFRNPQTYPVANFALAAFTVSLFGTFNDFVYRRWHNSWKYFVVTISGEVANRASLLTLVLIAADRYLLVEHPLKHRQLMNSKKSVLCLILVWLTGVLYEIRLRLFRKPSVYEVIVYRVSQKKGNHLIFRDILFVFKHKRFYAPVNLKCLLTVQL